MAQSTGQAVALLENIAFDTRIDDFAEETSPEIDIVSVLIDIPIGTGSVPVELPIYITVTVTIGTDGLIESVELSSDQALPVAATVAGDGLSATGVLPKVSWVEDGCQQEEEIFLPGGSYATLDGTWSIAGNSWTYTLNTPVTTAAEERIDQFTMWSVGSAYDIPRHHPFRYVNPEDWEAGDEDWEDWPAVPAGIDGATLTQVKPSWDPQLGRVPGSDEDRLELDSRLGLQLCDLFILPDTTANQAAVPPCC